MNIATAINFGAFTVTAQSKASSLVVFDDRLSGLDVLYEALLPGTVGFTIDSNTDALLEITRLLAETGAKKLSIVAHGEPGVVHIGAQSLNLSQLAARSGLLQEWCLDELALFSCEVGADVEFVGQLAQVTGAAVFAADTKVGAAALGGSWNLAVRSSNSEMTVPWSIADLASYQDVLAVVPATTGVDNFTGSGAPGDTTGLADTITITNPNQINPGDSFDGGGGTDEFSLGAGAFNFSGVVITSVENLTSDGSNTTQSVTLTAAQFASFTSIDLGNGVDTITINVSGVVDISGLLNPTILGVENIFLTGTGLNDTITLTGAQLNTILSAAGKSIDLGNGLDAINLTTTSTALNGLTDSQLVGVETISGATAAAAININLTAQTSEAFTIIGSANADIIVGGALSDTITGGLGADTISGGAGDDLFNEFDGADSVDGGAGTADTIKLTATSNDLNAATDAQIVGIEVVTAATAGAAVNINLSGQTTVGEAFTIVGSNFGDTLRGSAGADSIGGGGGNDTIVGFVGADTVNGGSGTSDTITLSATSADLNLATDTQIVSVEVIDASGSAAQVVIDLKAQTDGFTVIGSSSASFDIITGSSGADFLSGGLGSDDYIGFVGADTIVGGTGTADWIVLQATSNDLNIASDAQITGVELITANRVGLAATAGVEINLGAQTENFNIEGSVFNDTLTGGSGSGANVIAGLNGNDIINNFGVGDTVNGGADNDTLNVVANITATNAQILNVENISAARATSGVNLNLGAQSEVLNITGSVYADTILGGTNNDTIVGFVGADTVDGSGGTDTITLTGTSADLNAIPNTIAGDARIINIEAVSAAGATAGVAINLASQTEGFTITGSAFADTITGSAGIDAISSGVGNDVINGFTTTGLGDTVNGGADNDTLNITANLFATEAQIVSIENVSASGAIAPVTIDLSNQLAEGFVITGSGSGDTITGGGGADNISSAGGDDTIINFIGADTVDGGAGNNILRLDTNSTDLNTASDSRITNIQTIDAAAGFGAFDINLSNQTEGFKVIGSNSADTITGSSGADSISSGGGNDTVNGFAGNDTVDGGSGTDVIKLTATSTALNTATDLQIVSVEVVDASGAGSAVNLDLRLQTEGFVTLTGSAFDDTIFGSSGNDLIFGGGGNDTIGFDGVDTIDGGAGVDVITVASALTTLNDAQITSVDVITAAAALGPVTINVANQTEGLTVIGSAFADNITGGIGNDTINAGAGDDTINGWAGDNTVNGGLGQDSINLTTTSFTFNLALDTEIVDVESITTNGAAGPVNISLVNQTEGFTVTGTSFAETITGGKGDDTIVGFAGADTVSGGIAGVGGGFDTIKLTAPSIALNNATEGQILNIEAVSAATAAGPVTINLSNQGEGFVITGSGFADTITGGAGNDSILAGLGDDVVNGFVGTDTVDGGAGTNTLNLTATSATLNAATNAQVVNIQTVNLLGVGINVNLGTQAEGFTINGSTVSLGNATIRGGQGADNILAGDGVDFIDEFIGADTVDGGSSVLPLVSVDTLRLTATSTTLNAATDLQLINVEAVSAATATAGVNLNLKNQSEGFSTITGSAFSDSIAGSSGVDSINGGNGNDTIVGFVDGSGLFGDTVNGGANFDTIQLAATSADFNSALDNQIINVEEISADVALAGVEIDLRLQTSEDFIVRGSQFADTITGGDNIGATSGDDIRAGFGDDIIIGFVGDDTVDGGAGTGDTIKLAATSTTLNSNSLGGFGEVSHDAEIFNVEIISAADALAGVVVDLGVQTESFKIIGSAQGDTLEGGIGNDTIDGGAGEDFAVYDGFRTDYNIERIDGATTSWIVTDLLPLVDGNDGSDTLTNIENIQFNQGAPFQLIVDRFIGSLSDGNSATNEVLKNSANGTVVGLTAAAIDGDGQSVNYSLTNNAGGRFAIDASTGVVTVADSSLIATAATYSVTVKATSGDASFTSKLFSIDVKDTITPPATPGVRNDFDGDGKADILFRDNSNHNALFWKADGINLINPATQQFTIGNVGSSSWSLVGSGDFNGDKKSDVLWRNTDGSIAVWIGNGVNTFSQGAVIGNLAGTTFQVAGTGDFNGDLRDDILFKDATGAVAVWLTGSTGLSLASTGIIGSVGVGGWQVAGVADFTGDSKADILWRDTASGAIAVWQGNGTSAVTQTGVVGALLDPTWKIEGVDNFSGDSRSDILWRNTTDGTIAIWQGNGLAAITQTGIIGTVGGGAAGAAWDIAGSGNYNGDATADILFRNGNNVATWLTNGSLNSFAQGELIGTANSAWTISAPTI